MLFMGMYEQNISSVYVPHGFELQLVLHDTCFRHSTASPMFISIEFLTPIGVDYAHIMMTLDEQFLGAWLMEHLVLDEDLNLEDPISEEEALHILP